MLTTEHRPAPLPPRPAVGQHTGTRMALPAGAARWSRTWVDVRGLPQVSPYEVPVDVNDRRTEHVRHVCKGFIEVDGEKLPCDQVAWLLPGAPGRYCPDHGAELEPEASKRAGVPWPQVWDVVDERVRVAGVAATVGAAGVGVEITDQPWWGVAGELAAIPAVIAGSWWLTRWWLTRKAVKRERIDPADQVAGKRHRKLIDKRARIAGYVGGVGAGWIGLADLIGVDPTTGGGLTAWGLLGVAAVVGSKPYRQWVDSKRGIRAETIPEPEVGQPEKTSVEARAVQDAADWAATVAVSGGLPGTYVDLATWKADPGGRRMVIRNQGRRGAVTDEKIKQALPLIAGAFDVPISAVGWIAEYEGSPNAAQLFVQPNSPLNEVIPGEPIDILPVGKAIAHMGKRIDGSALVTRLFTPGWGAPSRAIFGTKGAGKALALGTPILTPNGWTTMGEVQTGDQVFDENGQVCNVTFAAPIMYGRPCYEVVFSDGTVIVADGEHRWKTSTLRGRWQKANHNRGKEPRPERRIILDQEPVTTEQIAATLKVDLGGNAGLCTNHAIDVCGPLEYPKRELPIAPYTLGAWLGDGRTKYASIASDDEEILERIRLDGYEVTQQAGPFMYGITNRPDRMRRIAAARVLIEQGAAVATAERHVGLAKGASGMRAGDRAGSGLAVPAEFGPPEDRHRSMPELLRHIGVLGNKHIPEQYLRSSVEQRRALLAGLLDTDGYCTPSGQVNFAVTSERLARDTYELVIGLGYKATLRTKQVKGRTEASSTCYTVAFTAHEPVFGLTRKAARQRPVAEASTSRRRYIVDVRPVPSVPVRCIAVDSPSHLYLASRACIATHNTEMLRRLLLVQLKARIETEYGPKRLVAPFMHDPKRGADYGAFRRRVCGFSIDSATLHMIVDAFGREMDRRYDALAGTVWVDDKGREREGERPFDPATMGPILSLTIDEFHVDAKDQALMAKLDPFARKMRAAGIEINIATHVATIGDTGSQGFRDMLAGGEAWLMRTTMGLNAALATGGTLNGDPRALPRVPGMVLQASGEDITMQARVAYDDGEAVYDMLYDDDNNSRIQPVDWTAETLEAFGPEFVEWMRASQERQLGSAAVSAPNGYQPSGSTPDAGEDRRAFDVLLAILSGATRPFKRSDIVNDARWTFSVKTLTNVLRAGQDSDEPMLRKVEGSNGAYELTEAGRARHGLDRERVEAQRAESAEAGE